MLEKKRRVKGVVHYEETHRSFEGTRDVSWSVTDDLDKKEECEATNKFEPLFIRIRKILESNASSCMDEESERLSICQALSDMVNKKYKPKKKV